MTTLVASTEFVSRLLVSIVVYRPDMPMLERALASLNTAFEAVKRTRPSAKLDVCVINNGGLPASFYTNPRGYRVLSGHGNVGYGRGHNLAFDGTSDYHLILNPDIEIETNALVEALAFFDVNPEVGLIAPLTFGEGGKIQYLCRRFPTVLDLFVRGFLPTRLRRPFTARLAHYEMRDLINPSDVVFNPPIISGCFMLFRTPILAALGGFDARYFLYFEDYDLSLRAGRVTQIAYVPSVRVTHFGGGAARKGGAHIRMFVASAFQFFNHFGWKWL